MPSYYGWYDGGCASIGTDIYLFGSRYGVGTYTLAYKYDTLTNTYTQLTNIPSNFYYGACASVGTNIYLFDGSSDDKYVYKYDTLTDTYTRLASYFYKFNGGDCTVIGTNIYLFGGSSISTTSESAYKYDTLTDTYTQLTNIPYAFMECSCTSIGTDIYLFGGMISSLYHAYKYDTLTDTYTQLTDIPYEFKGRSASVNTDLYLFGINTDGSNNKQGAYKLCLSGDTSYNVDDAVIVSQADIVTPYKTELITINSISNNYQPLTEFSNVGYYTTQGGLDLTTPTYYGDGAQWINIKNPVSNE